jgi:hypothetical protein
VSSEQLQAAVDALGEPRLRTLQDIQRIAAYQQQHPGISWSKAKAAVIGSDDGEQDSGPEEEYQYISIDEAEQNLE